MIRLTKITDYGFVLLSPMAQAEARKMYNARDLAEMTGIPLPMVSKTLKSLAREGFIDSQRGVKGGYFLNRPPDQISVAEVIAALEGPIALTECAEQESHDCVAESNCPVKTNWQLITEAVNQALDGISLKELASPSCQCRIERPTLVGETPGAETQATRR